MKKQRDATAQRRWEFCERRVGDFYSELGGGGFSEVWGNLVAAVVD